MFDFYRQRLLSNCRSSLRTVTLMISLVQLQLKAFVPKCFSPNILSIACFAFSVKLRLDHVVIKFYWFFVYLFASKCLCLPHIGCGWFHFNFKDQLKLSCHKFWGHLFTIVLECNSPLYGGNMCSSTSDGMTLLHCKYNAHDRLRMY